MSNIMFVNIHCLIVTKLILYHFECKTIHIYLVGANIAGILCYLKIKLDIEKCAAIQKQKLDTFKELWVK